MSFFYDMFNKNLSIVNFCKVPEKVSFRNTVLPNTCCYSLVKFGALYLVLLIIIKQNFLRIALLLLWATLKI